MKKTPTEKYIESEKEIPIWKQKLVSIESEEQKEDELMRHHLYLAYNSSIRIEKLKAQKENILREKNDKLLWPIKGIIRNV